MTITSDGSVSPTTGTAVSLDSSNAISNAGTISIQDADGAVGVAIAGGVSGSLANSGSITIDETTTEEDADGDGDLDTAFAVGSSRYGVRLTGAAPFTGTITNAGSISVEGNDSVGLSLEAPLVGSLVNSGSVFITGSRAIGLNLASPIAGDVSVTGDVSAIGESAQAIRLGGDISGAMTIQGGVVATGYRYTTRPTDADTLAALDSDDLLQGGPAVAIRASVGGGLLIDAPPADTDSSVGDEDGDGVDDIYEGTGSIISYGAAPAIEVGAPDRDVALGNVGTGDLAYGIVIKGYVAGSGVYDGVAATGLQLGTTGGGAVTTGGGVWISGSVSASSYAATATALIVNAGASAPVIRNDGAIDSTITAEGLVQARGLVIEPGGSVTSFLNSGRISATLYGEAGDAVAIRDLSGTLVDIQNVRTISAVISPTDDASDTDDSDTNAANEKVTGRAIALDLAANVTGVAVVQNGINDGDDLGDGVADADEDGDGVDDADEPSIVGDILFGSGSDRLRVLNGTIAGDIAFGGGANELTIGGGASVRGAITAAGGTLDLAIGSGSLEILNTGLLNLASLNLGASSKLMLTVDPASGATTFLDVGGAADIADGAKIGLRLTSLLKTTAAYQLIRANQLNADALNGALVEDLPYLYAATVATDAAAGTLTVSVSRKTAAQLGLPDGTASAYEPFVAAVDRDVEVRDAVLAQSDREGLFSIYNQMLPEHRNGAFEILALGSRSLARAASDREGNDHGGAWVQEVQFGLRQDASATADGYNAWSLGLVGGYETPRLSFGTFGLTLGATSSEVDSHLVVNALEAGVGWRFDLGGLRLKARAAAGYVALRNDRTVSVYDENDARILLREATAHWSGVTTAAEVGVAYRQNLGEAFYLRPEASLEYFSLRENAYQEAGGGAAIDLAVDARSSQRASSLVALAAGFEFRERESYWAPEIKIGWRSAGSQTIDQTVARFVSDNATFALAPEVAAGDGWIARAAVRGGNDYGSYVVEGGAEVRDGITTMDLRLGAHFYF